MLGLIPKRSRPGLVVDAVQEWLLVGEVRPRLGWLGQEYRPDPAEGIGLFGAIAAELYHGVTRTRRLIRCKTPDCPEWVIGRSNKEYCSESCNKRDAARRRRERRREESIQTRRRDHRQHVGTAADEHPQRVRQ
jgi:hypothetical protein